MNLRKKVLWIWPQQLIRITSVHHKSDSNNQMIQLTDMFCVLLRYKKAHNFWLQKRLILLSVILCISHGLWKYIIPVNVQVCDILNYGSAVYFVFYFCF